MHRWSHFPFSGKGHAFVYWRPHRYHSLHTSLHISRGCGETRMESAAPHTASVKPRPFP